MTGQWTYKYADGIPAEDREVLEEKKNAILSALQWRPIFWPCLVDDQGRNHYQAVDYSARETVLCQFVVGDIVALDADDLTNRIIRGDFCRRDIPRGGSSDSFTVQNAENSDT